MAWFQQLGSTMPVSAGASPLASAGRWLIFFVLFFIIASLKESFSQLLSVTGKPLWPQAHSVPAQSLEVWQALANFL